MPALDKDDKATAIGLMVRLVRVQKERDRLTEIKKEVDEKQAALSVQWNRCRDAFAILGFDPSSKDLWNDVRDAVGLQEWNAAFERAKAAPLPETPILSLLPPPPPPPPREGSSEDDGEPDELTDTSFEGIEEPPQSVREFTLEALKTADQRGTKAADIRAAYESARNTKLHDKTIGMTLYRLSKDNLARRDGRTWFYVSPEGEAKNANVGAPGLTEMLK